MVKSILADIRPVYIKSIFVGTTRKTIDCLNLVNFCLNIQIMNQPFFPYYSLMAAILFCFSTFKSNNVTAQETYKFGPNSWRYGNIPVVEYDEVSDTYARFLLEELGY